MWRLAAGRASRFAAASFALSKPRVRFHFRRMRARTIFLLLMVLAVAAGVVWWQVDRATPRLGQAAYDETAAILAKGPRPPGSAGLDAVRGHVRARLEQTGWVTTGQAFERVTPIGKVRFENVRARFKSGADDPWARPVRALLCAHIDSKYYKDRHFLGADDAASACAAIVVLASHLARENPQQAAALELVFFDGEEAFNENITPQDGLYGSRHYANQWRAQPHKPQFGILLDMIGHQNLSIRLPSDTPAHLKEAVFAAARAEEVEGYFGMAPGPIIDDHVPLNFAGIPTVDIIGDFTRSKWWHTPADNLKIVSAESLDISMRVVLRMLDDLLGK